MYKNPSKLVRAKGVVNDPNSKISADKRKFPVEGVEYRSYQIAKEKNPKASKDELIEAVYRLLGGAIQGEDPGDKDDPRRSLKAGLIKEENIGMEEEEVGKKGVKRKKR